MKRIYYTIIAVLLIVISPSCKKYLDKVPDQRLAIPSSLTDMKLLLDNYTVMNTRFPNSMEIQSDNYYVNPEHWEAISDEKIRNLYIWQKGETVLWAPMYNAILYANIVIDGLADIKFQSSERALYNNVYGSALFFRSYYYYLVAQTYGIAYDKHTASTDLGIVLRSSSNFDELSKRSNNEETYREIIKGFEKAIELLPSEQGYKTQPTKASAYGALARIYLSMQDYARAGKYADSCIMNYGKDNLLDFNDPKDIDNNSVTPIKTFNKEVIFHLVGAGSPLLSVSRAKIDKELYASYNENDLRKKIFFKANLGANAGTFSLRGGYDGGLGGATPQIFGGIALDEMYLMRAECRARDGLVTEAMQDLNKLLSHRWAVGTFVPLTASDRDGALKKILVERRKELIYRGTRWIDLRRLMKEQSLAVIPRRTLGNTVFELLPNTSGYVLQIPIAVINQTNIPQNP